MKCAAEEGAEEILVLTRFINWRPPPRSCSRLYCRFQLHLYASGRGKDGERRSERQARFTEKADNRGVIDVCHLKEIHGSAT